jgi:anaphase-promoting complex subunit 1
MIVLGKGDDAAELDDLRITERLRRYMEGGKIQATGTHLRTGGMLGQPATDTSYQVSEGDTVNIDVTSPGATIALAFMYMKTHNKAVAARLVVPDTQFLLECIRPDFLLLRTLSHSLIMWDGIEPTAAWVEAKCPTVVLRFRLGAAADGAERPGGGGGDGGGGDDLGEIHKPDMETLRQTYVNVAAGGCLAIGLRYAGSANEAAVECLLYFANLFLARAGGGVLATQQRDVGRCVLMPPHLRFLPQETPRLCSAVPVVLQHDFPGLCCNLALAAAYRGLWRKLATGSSSSAAAAVAGF